MKNQALNTQYREPSTQYDGSRGISYQLDELSLQIGELQGVLEEFEKRAGSFLLPTPPMGGADSKVQPAPLCSEARRSLEDSLATLSVVRDRIVSLSGRIDI